MLMLHGLTKRAVFNTDKCFIVSEMPSGRDITPAGWGYRRKYLAAEWGERWWWLGSGQWRRRARARCRPRWWRGGTLSGRRHHGRPTGGGVAGEGGRAV